MFQVEAEVAELQSTVERKDKELESKDKELETNAMDLLATKNLLEEANHKLKEANSKLEEAEKDKDRNQISVRKGPRFLGPARPAANLPRPGPARPFSNTESDSNSTAAEGYRRFDRGKCQTGAM